MEERATGERAKASQLRVNHFFHFSVRSREGRKEGGRMDGGGWREQLALQRPQGERKLIIRLRLLGEESWDAHAF